MMKITKNSKFLDYKDLEVMNYYISTVKSGVHILIMEEKEYFCTESEGSF